MRTENISFCLEENLDEFFDLDIRVTLVSHEDEGTFSTTPFTDTDDCTTGECS